MCLFLKKIWKIQYPKKCVQQRTRFNEVLTTKYQFKG